MSIVSGPMTAIMGANATESASNTAADAQSYAADKALQGQREALAQQKEIYNNQRADFAPYKGIGERGVQDYTKLMNGEYDMKQSPAAQYQLTQGTKALNRSLAARGLSGSGNAAQRLTELNSNIAASDWANQYSRITDALKIGQGAASSVANAGSQMANNYGQSANAQAGIYGNMGNNMANIAMQQGQNQASLYSGLGGMTTRAATTGIGALNAYSAYQESEAAAALAEMW